MWLKTVHIMNLTKSPVDVHKTKNATEGDKVNAIMSTISHPMNLISIPVLEICDMELGQDLSIPIIPETHDICQLKAITGLDCSSKLIPFF
jgi:hypothetical protein